MSGPVTSRADWEYEAMFDVNKIEDSRTMALCTEV